MLMGQKQIFFEKMFTPTCVRSKCSAQHGDHFEVCMVGYPRPPHSPLSDPTHAQ